MSDESEEEERLIDDFMQTAHLNKLTVRRTVCRGTRPPAPLGPVISAAGLEKERQRETGRDGEGQLVCRKGRGAGEYGPEQ